MAHKVLFIDRDGTLIREPEDRQVDALQKVRLMDGVIPALICLRDTGYRLLIVSNQDGLGTDSFPKDRYRICQDHMLALFASQGIVFDEVFVCPHKADDHCACRKPRTGLLTRYLAANDLDLDQSAVIGDRRTDLELARRIGVPGFLIDSNAVDGHNWASIVRALCYNDRTATVVRNTRETAIQVSVNLDRETGSSIATGIGFFDHMLEQIARHGGFSLQLACTGDLHVDEHHTVEDTAICLGAALRGALGEKRGAGRYGFLLPMDESEAQVSLDLSGRGISRFHGEFSRQQIGALSIEMVKHFFSSFADSLGAALHIRVEGRNAHHMVEACFKSVGRALRQAIRVEGAELPTTKGSLN